MLSDILTIEQGQQLKGTPQDTRSIKYLYSLLKILIKDSGMRDAFHIYDVHRQYHSNLQTRMTVTAAAPEPSTVALLCNETAREIARSKFSLQPSIILSVATFYALLELDP